MKILVVMLALAAAPQLLFRVSDSRIDEASGIARGIRSPDVYYVQNDSGDPARFFAVDRATGRTAATVTVPGATNVDWEDIAVARNAAGKASVFIGDIGDNNARRTQIQLYRLDEPAVLGTDRGRSIQSARPQVWHLRYPDGAHNAEALALKPDGTAYIVTKAPSGSSGVYRVPPNPSSGVQTLTKMGSIRFASTGRTNRVAGSAASLLATGAAISTDGTLFVVRTYTEAYVWTVRNGDIAAALQAAPRQVALPSQPQGEGVAVVNGRLIVNSEGKNQPVYAVTVPTAARASSTAPTPPAVQTVTAVAPTPIATAALRRGSRRGASHTRLVVAAVVAIVLAAVVRLARPKHRAG